MANDDARPLSGEVTGARHPIHSGDVINAGDRIEAVVALRLAPGTDAVYAEQLIRRLHRDIAQIDGVEVRPAPPERVPEGAKGADGASALALLVAMTASGGALSLLVRTLNTWLAQRPGRRITMTLTVGGDSLTIDGATHDQAQELIRAFVDARERPAPGGTTAPTTAGHG
jgi:hypothetical protein